MVFVRRNTEKMETLFDVGNTIVAKTRHTPGQVGLEIEVEGARLPKDPESRYGVPRLWAAHPDGSLRGDDNCEYVLKKPILFSEVNGALDDLWKVFKGLGSRLDDSNRTSVHVHLNVQTFHLNRLTSLMAMYFVLEEVLTEWCGDHRVGNLFCLRAKDAPAIISQIRRFIRANMQAPLREHHHYAGLNTNALHKFGSLEFRALRGVADPEAIKQWVAILQRLYELSEDYTDPRDICAAFSQNGPTAFFNDMLGPLADTVRKGVSMSHDDIATSMYEGIRMAQDLCYSRDWDRFKGIAYKPDPFGRNKKGPGLSPEMAVLEQYFGEHVHTHAPPPTALGWATANQFTINPSTGQITPQAAPQAINTLDTLAQAVAAAEEEDEGPGEWDEGPGEWADTFIDEDPLA